ncbi:MAG TPA: cobalamin-dependent protein [Solirubrobacteraceae bacterium]|jgi:hypothetical protein|nr:cobalamin-dependent protein [Solirubrobacteraceae bacterium]
MVSDLEEPTARRRAYASTLAHAFSGVRQLDGAIELLRAPPVDDEAAALDAHLRVTRLHVEAVAEALARLDRPALLALQAAAELPPVDLPKLRPRDATLDAVATWLIRTLRRPGDARALAVATGRLVEESRVLHPAARKTAPLGRGFEAELHRRLALRFALLPDRAGHLAALEQHLGLLLEEPDEGLAEIERTVGRPLTPDEREWLEAERFAGLLHAVRHRKTEAGQIRWFLRRDERHGVVLDRYGVHGHWLVAGRADAQTLVRAGTAAARVVGEDEPVAGAAWRAVIAGDPPEAGPSAPPPLELHDAHLLPLDGAAGDSATTARARARRALSGADPGGAAEAVARAAVAPPSRAPSGEAAEAIALAAPAAPPLARPDAYVLTADGNGLALAPAGEEGPREPLARVPHDAGDDELLAFLDAVGRVAEATSVVDAVDDRHGGSEAVRWTRALLADRSRRPAASPAGGDDLAGLSVRLLYVPARTPHPLGGMPLVGLRFLRDRLERAGARAEMLSIAPDDLERRLVELLGADVIGIGVYVSNREEVARLVPMLRSAGFTGRIVLGGPELRDVDGVQESVAGWDALIRGEGEDAFPQVLRVLHRLDRGELGEALRLARSLRGVVVAHGQLVVIADSAARNAVAEIACPLPFEWSRGLADRTLHMNFTRGCPYGCVFCPNHQGQKIKAGEPDQMWDFTLSAAADALELAPADAERCAAAIQGALGVEAPPRLRPALDLLLRGPVPIALLRRLCADLSGSPDALAGEPGADAATPWEAKRVWLRAKAALLAGDERARGATLAPFELITSEDNTLVNRDAVRGYLLQRRASGLAGRVVFNPGQNTIRDLTDRRGGVDVEYVADLTDANPFRVALGTDGTSNPVLRQNHKPYYGVADVVAVNRALVSRGVHVQNNYILLTPETDLLETVEAMALFVLLPIAWRDHGGSINLRIVKEHGTLSHDEGLLFAPGDEAFHDPFRFPEVDALLARWDLTPAVRSTDLVPLLWRILEEDPQARELLPLVVRRWERDFDGDPVLVALAARIRAAWRPDASLATTLREVADAYREEWLESDESAPADGARRRGGSGRGRPARRRAPAPAGRPVRP